MDMQHASQEHIMRTVLYEKRIHGLPAFAKEQEWQSIKISLDQQTLPNKEFAQALESAKVDLLQFLQFSPTCISQNFICYYTVEALLQHQGSNYPHGRAKEDASEDELRPPMVEFELFLNNSEQLMDLLEKMSKNE
jgi:hypothetical protein